MPFKQCQQFSWQSPGKRIVKPLQQEAHSANITACINAGYTTLDHIHVTRGTAFVGYCETHLHEHWGYCPCRGCQQRRWDDMDTDHPDTRLLVGPLMLIIRRRPATPDLKQVLPLRTPVSPAFTAISPRPTGDVHLFAIQGQAVELSLDVGGNRFLSVPTGQAGEPPALLVAAYDIGHCAAWQTDELEFMAWAITDTHGIEGSPWGAEHQATAAQEAQPMPEAHVASTDQAAALLALMTQLAAPHLLRRRGASATPTAAMDTTPPTAAPLAPLRPEIASSFVGPRSQKLPAAP